MWALLGLIPIVTTAWEYHPEAGAALYTVYTPDDHGGGAISSDIAEDRYGNLYFANEAGLLKFDGVRWALMPDTRQTDYTTSVTIDQQDRIWRTGIKSLGYYQADESGNYRYTDMTETVLAIQRSKDLSVFWKLYADGGHIYLITSFCVLRWDGDAWHSWPPFDVERRILPSWVDGKLTIHARGEGLFQLNNESFTRIAEDTDAVASGIISIFPGTTEGLLCVTVSNGLFRLKDGHFTNIPTDADAQLQQTQTLDAHRLQNETLVLASINEGVLMLDKAGCVIHRIRHDKGASYCLLEHSSGSIWAGNANGILEIPSLPITHYSDTAQDIVRHDGTLFYTNLNELNIIEKRVAGQAGATVDTLLQTSSSWDLQSIGTDLLCGEGQHLSVIHKEMQPIQIASPHQIMYLFPSGKDASLIYTSAPPHISRWRKTASKWAWQDALPDFNGGCHSLVELPNGKLLFSSADSPLFLSDWSLTAPGSGDRPQTTPLGQAHGIPDQFSWAYCLRQGDTIVVISNRGLYRYDTETERFRYDPILGNDLDTDAYAFEFCPLAEQAGWILSLPTKDGRGQIGALHVRPRQQLDWKPWQLPTIHRAGKIESLLHEKTDDAETLWVGGSKDILRYNLSAMRDFPHSKVRLTAITEVSTHSTHYGGGGDLPRQIDWSFPQKSLHIKFAASIGALKIKGYQTRLIGFENSWSPLNQSPYSNYTNLLEGNYRFEVRAIDEFDRAGPITRLDFTILPPWYRSAYAYTGYIALGFIIIVLLTRWWTLRLRRRNAELEAMVNQRTIELEHRNLELHKANNVKQDFLASMSHEIRNPLNGILGITRLMQVDEARAKSPSPRVSHLYSCASHLHQLLGKVLDYSSVESGKMKLISEPFYVTSVINEVIAMHQSLADSKGLELQLDLPEIHDQWIGDPTPLRQILINLISNAIKYTPEGSVSLRLNYQNEDGIIAASFVVKDTGPGIPKDRQAYIFEQFTRLSKPGESQTPGTGLGLAIASKMARLMQGTLELDDGVKSGACFVLKLPFGQSDAITSPPLKNKPQRARPLRGRKALIADDMDFNRYIGREILEKMGAQVQDASDGTRALELLRTTRFDWVVLDVSMPGLSGIEVVENYLSDGTIQPPKFIALSAHATEQVEASCLAVGFDHFIEKPLDPERIYELIDDEQWIDSPRTTGGDNHLLNYLAGDDPKAVIALQIRYRESLLKELWQLRQIIKQNDAEALRGSVHKLSGLANIQKNPAVLHVLKTISTKIIAETPIDQLPELCDQLESAIEGAANTTQARN